MKYQHLQFFADVLLAINQQLEKTGIARPLIGATEEEIAAAERHISRYLTLTARSCLSLLAALRVLPLLKDNENCLIRNGEDQYISTIYPRICQSFALAFDWLDRGEIDADRFYEEHTLAIDEDFIKGWYDDPKEEAAFSACFDAVYVVNQAMHVKASMATDAVTNAVTMRVVEYCLIRAQEASDNPEAEKAWQEQIRTHLLQDYGIYTSPDEGSNYTSEEIGQPISRSYMEELFGGELPVALPISSFQKTPIVSIRRDLTLAGRSCLSLLSALRGLSVLEDKATGLRDWLIAHDRLAEYPAFEDEKAFAEWSAAVYPHICHSLALGCAWLGGATVEAVYFDERHVSGLTDDILWEFYDEIHLTVISALSACYEAVHITAHAMHAKENRILATAEYGMTMWKVERCLTSARDASDDPKSEKLWQEQITARLLQDHGFDTALGSPEASKTPEQLGRPYTQEEIGKSISRAYMEELFGGELPI